jgi:hypothetical protein
MIINSSLTYLQFSEDFNEPVDHLPQGLKKLVLGIAFNQKLDNLPDLLTWLKFQQHSNFFQIAQITHPPYFYRLYL